ncbi:MAG: ABC transporter permease [Saprospiraceae bacterium]|nr:ABC transporter permease [Saprospiraceae bacterium]
MKGLSFDIARRYLFGKKSTNSINIITAISVFGISIGTAVLILILSVFNGFESLISSLFNAFNPDVKIVAVEGKFFHIDSTSIYQLKQIDGIEHLSKTIEEVALFEYKGTQEIGIIKGVDEHFAEATGLDSFVINGQFILQDRNIQYAVLGAGMRNKLSLNIDDKLSPLSVYMPLKKKQFLGAKEYKFMDLYPGGIFSVQSDNDFSYILCSFDFASRLLEERERYSALELKIDESRSREIINKIKEITGDDLKINDRYQQDEAFLKVMEIEKWISFLITGFTMLLIAFNLVGALWMIVLDKRKDIAILKSMGCTTKDIRSIFMKLGILISGLGVVTGIGLAFLLYYIQKQYGIIGVPSGFLIDAYPVHLRVTDFLIVIPTVFIIGLLAAVLPSRKAGNSDMVLRSQ